jgi:intracellular multiplication protein IcmG
MADDEQKKNETNDSDEYQFADLDVLGTEQDAAPLSNEAAPEDGEEGVASPPGRGRFDHLDPNVLKIVRKGIISVAALFFVLFMYKIVLSFTHSTTSKKKSTATAAAVATPMEKLETAKKTPPVQQLIPSSSQKETSNTNTSGAVSSLKQEQKRIDTEVAAMRTQVSTATQSINDVATKMAELQQTLLVLNERLEQQSQQMTRLQSMTRTKRATSSKPPPRARPAIPKAVYSIQAIIPGRAWIMSNQGKTLTVSRGSAIPGYGTVRTINAKVGRVFTSSGRVIRFSQADT